MKRPVEEIQQRLKAPGSQPPPRESTAGESKCPTHLLHPITPSSRSTQAYDNRRLWHESAPNLRSRVDKEDSPRSYTLRKLRTIRRINFGCQKSRGHFVTPDGGVPLESERLWYVGFPVGFDVIPTCTEADFRER